MMNRSNRKHAKRRGFLSLELAAALPVLLAVLAATVEFSLLLSAQGTLTDASRAAARCAALGVRDNEKLDAIVRSSLGPRLGAAAETRVVSDDASGTINVAIRLPMRAAAPNLLWPIGYDLSGRHLAASACMAAETN